MTMNPFESLEKVWGDLLSREPNLVKGAFEKLDPDNRHKIITHLKAMVDEKGWHKEQIKSARIALKTIQSNFPKVNNH